MKVLLAVAMGKNLDELCQAMLGAPLHEIFDLYPEDVLIKYLNDLKDILEGRSIKSSYPSDETLIHILYLLVLRSKSLAHRFLTYLTKATSKTLSNLLDEELLRIAKSLGLNFKIDNRCDEYIIEFVDERGRSLTSCYRYSLPYYQYIEATLRLSKDLKWKFTNQYVKKGMVYLRDKRQVVRIIEEAMLKRTVDHLDKLITDNTVVEVLSRSIPEKLLDRIKALSNELAYYSTPLHNNTARSTSKEFESVNSKELKIESYEQLENLKPYFPPCIQQILDRLLEKTNLSHQERFALATFMINIGVELELLLELFKLAPDFNERIARYQIEHLAGLRGSRKKYLPYNCDTMKVMNLCVSECGVRNPLTYFYRQLRRVNKVKK
ncbi:MAG: hypothetical protein DRO12_00435 [Thermoprotei archaeon]|nr:MAG: hypothetical protein DRO12_00435 [Thermoprotei archaeon]